MEALSLIDVILQFLEAFFGVIRIAFHAIWNALGAPFLFNFFPLLIWRICLIGFIILLIVKKLLR